MSLKDLLADGSVRPHRTSAREVADLLRVVERDLTDAGIEELSLDRRFATAYNAALQLATIALYAAGYRVAALGHHRVTFRVLPEVMGAGVHARAAYFDKCRLKRNVTDYDRAGAISEGEVEEILSEVRAFREEVQVWLKKNHPALFPPSLP